MSTLLIKFKDNDYTYSICKALFNLYQETDPTSELSEQILTLHEKGLLHEVLVDIFSAQHLLQRALTRVRIARFGIPLPKDQGETKAYLSSLEYVIGLTEEEISDIPANNNEWVWFDMKNGDTATI